MSSLPIARFKYTGTALPGISETVKLFDTTVAFPGKRGLPASGIEMFVLHLSTEETGTLNAYKSQDRGTTWTLIHTSTLTTVNTLLTTRRVFDVAAFEDFKIEFVNSTTAQQTFLVDMAGSYDRAAEVLS